MGTSDAAFTQHHPELPYPPTGSNRAKCQLAKMRNAIPGQRPPKAANTYVRFGGRWPGVAFLTLALSGKLGTRPYCPCTTASRQLLLISLPPTSSRPSYPRQRAVSSLNLKPPSWKTDQTLSRPHFLHANIGFLPSDFYELISYPSLSCLPGQLQWPLTVFLKTSYKLYLEMSSMIVLNMRVLVA
jgi:hypothetical protein